MRKKSKKFSNYQCLSAFFPKFSTDFVDWNVAKGHQRRNVLSSRLFRRVFCNFLSEKVSNCHRKNKKHKIFQMAKILCFLCYSFDRISGFECFKVSTRKKLVVQYSSMTGKLQCSE